MNAKQAYILSKNYTASSLDGVGALQGASCQIDSIVPSLDGKYSIVTFKWISNSGIEYTSELEVENGDNGMSIESAVLSADEENKYHMIVTYEDGTTKDAGVIPTPTVEVGDTETLEYDEMAEVTQEVVENGIKLNFKIPRGAPGTSDPNWNIV